MKRVELDQEAFHDSYDGLKVACPFCGRKRILRDTKNFNCYCGATFSITVEVTKEATLDEK